MCKVDKIILGAKLHDARKAAGFSTDRVAELCDCAATTIRAMEGGARLPSVPMLVRLCNVLQISPNELLRNEFTFPLADFDQVEEERTRDLLLKLQRLPSEKRELVCDVLDTLLYKIETL